MSYFVARALHVAADLGLADLVAEAPTAISAVARAAQCEERALARLLRVLSAQGIFDTDDATVRHTEASRLLRSDHPYSLRAFAQMFGLPVMWRSAEALTHSIRTGEAAAPVVFPEAGFWGYLADNPEHARIFDAAMASKTRGQIAGILSSYDFSGVASVADIGGGRGLLLSAIVQRHPE
ncbi:MAG TPA: methyltransferase, partial [Burkholderiaceae bacterium]|nr:methyltransferase [Burkholderiaceae bacterium]